MTKIHSRESKTYNRTDLLLVKNRNVNVIDCRQKARERQVRERERESVCECVVDYVLS